MLMPGCGHFHVLRLVTYPFPTPPLQVVSYSSQLSGHLWTVAAPAMLNWEIEIGSFANIMRYGGL